MSEEYCLISPCRNEAAYMRRTLDSVLSQTIRPARWVIVNDGSTDDTSQILHTYCSQYDWITVIVREDRGRRNVGPGVIDAFYDGLNAVHLDEFEYICKLDLDLELPERYFETLIERMRKDPRIGTCSGKPYYPAFSNIDKSFDGELVSEGCGDEMSVGASKFYRTECFRQIGGFVREVMWDGIDCHRCRMLGWIAVSWDDPELRFLHLRPMGSSQHGVLTGRMRHGFGQYFMGTSISYMTASAIFRMTKAPHVVGGLAMWLGYVRSMIRGDKRYDDSEFRSFLRRYQFACLVRGKMRATQMLDTAQAIAWNPSPPCRAEQAGLKECSDIVSRSATASWSN